MIRGDVAIYSTLPVIVNDGPLYLLYSTYYLVCQGLKVGVVNFAKNSSLPSEW